MTYIEPDILRDMFFDALDDDTFQVSKFWDNLHGNVTGEDACEIGNTIIAILQEAIKEKEEEIEAQQEANFQQYMKDHNNVDPDAWREAQL